MDNKQKLLGFISLCRKAGKLCVGFDATKDKVLRGQVYLLLLASDASAKTQKECHYYCSEDEIPAMSLPFTKAELALMLGREIGVMGVLDGSFAQGIEKRLQEQ